MDTQLDILKKLPEDNTINYASSLETGGDSLRSFTQEEPPQQEAVDPLTLKHFRHPYVLKNYTMDEQVALLLQRAADPTCYRCKGNGFQWRTNGWVANRCRCVQDPREG